MSGDELGSKFSYAPILGKGVLRGQKRKICPFLSQSTENQKLYNISKNQPTKSIRGGDMGFSPFLTLKKFCSSPISPPNQARKLKLGMYIQQVPQMCLLGVSTFQPYFNPFQSQKSYFLTDFFILIISRVCSPHNSPPNRGRKLKFVMYVE